MSCKIIKERERKTVEEYELCFDIDDCGGLAFPCDKDGNVILEHMTDAAKANYAVALTNPEKFCRKPYTKKRKWSYTDPAVAECPYCKTHFELVNEYLGACECPGCGHWYNLSGQELKNPEEWSKGEDW